MGETKVLTKSEVHLQLDELAMQLLLLCQNYIDTKLKLEQFMKEGFITMAQARNSMGGPCTVSALQLPNEDWEDFEATKKVSLSESKRQEINVKFNYLSLETGSNTKPDKVENLDSGLVNRKNKTEIKDDDKKKVKAKDPLKWFGVLVPQTLRQSQKHFSKAIELSVEATNIRNEIRGLLGQRQYLLRQKKKCDE